MTPAVKKLKSFFPHLEKLSVVIKNITRPLNRAEKIYQTNPSGMAGLHYREAGESNNPYTAGSVDSKKYIESFQSFINFEDQSF
jgi:hypothetical protein